MSTSTSERYLPKTVSLHGDAVVELLRAWFLAEGRRFPWRRDAEPVHRAIARGDAVNDPYLVLVSEVMLQQTQTTRVAEMLPRFLERFPSVEALATATRGDVLRAWQGLGYNSRAVRLHEAAREIAARGGEFPRELEELRRLRGIGPYTAAAIACFAFGLDVPVVDVNIQRVLSRLFFRCHTRDARMPEETITRIDRALLRPGESYWWHQALMDHGATICTARRPACERCSLVSVCVSAFPRQLALFGSEKSTEPMIAGAPRRIWRGRIVEQLRRTHEAIEIVALYSGLEGNASLSETDRRQIRDLVARLAEEGIVEIESGRVADGGLDERTRIRLTA